MKKSLLIVALPVLGLVSCLKKDTGVACVPAEVTIKAPDNEISALGGILSGSGISTTKDPRGFYYVIGNAGAGAKPNNCSNITIAYNALLLNGTSVDSSPNASFNLGQLITGWKEALPLIAAGGDITLYLPPSLAYGAAANGDIPANSNLKFTITLKAVD